MSSKPAPAPIASEVDILKTKAAAKRGVGALDGQTETIWPKPEFVCPLLLSPSLRLMDRAPRPRLNSSLKRARKLVDLHFLLVVCSL